MNKGFFRTKDGRQNKLSAEVVEAGNVPTFKRDLYRNMNRKGLEPNAEGILVGWDELGLFPCSMTL